MIGEAFALASRLFKNRVDKGGKPYILHCIEVWKVVQEDDEDIQCAAILHDVLEDTKITDRELLDIGFSTKTVSLIKVLTHDKENESYDLYIRRIGSYPWAAKIKRGDLVHNSNITRLKGLTKNDFDRMENYHRAYMYLSKI